MSNVDGDYAAAAVFRNRDDFNPVRHQRVQSCVGGRCSVAGVASEMWLEPLLEG